MPIVPHCLIVVSAYLKTGLVAFKCCCSCRFGLTHWQITPLEIHKTNNSRIFAIYLICIHKMFVCICVKYANLPKTFEFFW